MKRRNFFSTLLAGALGLVGMSRVRREERVTDRLRRRLQKNQDNLRRHIEEHLRCIEENQRMLGVEKVWVKKTDICPEDLEGGSIQLITCDEMPKPIPLPEMPPEVLEFYELWKKGHGL